ncbi:MAG: hypothetical protein MJ085_00430 [Clostridia bacterium]|nr:hypothetical protein [Clostridia bacterium]
MNCPRCYQENPEGSTYCNRCGESLIPAVRRRRPVARGIVGLALSVPGLFFSMYTTLFSSIGTVIKYTGGEDEFAEVISTVYCVVFGIIALGLSITALALGRSAKDVCEQKPNHYRGGGMYTTAQVLGSIGCGLCALSAILLVLIWR